MSSKLSAAGVDAAAVDGRLPRTFFVARGDIQDAFGLTRREISTLVRKGTFVRKYPLGKGTRARFVRKQVLAVARQWEGV